MEIQHFIQDKTLIIIPIEKRFDVISSPQLKEKILQLINQTQLQQIIFDLHHINFIDSAGLVCFLSLWKDFHHKNGNVKFANLTPPVKQIIELVLLNRVFDIYDNVDEAILEKKSND